MAFSTKLNKRFKSKASDLYHTYNYELEAIVNNLLKSYRVSDFMETWQNHVSTKFLKSLGANDRYVTLADRIKSDAIFLYKAVISEYPNVTLYGKSRIIELLSLMLLDAAYFATDWYDYHDIFVSLNNR